jgi:glycosyltransferase involved in cell wall biosynthesis
MSPLFTIVVPALNEERYLPLLIKDLAKQTFTNFDIIVVDGKSEDETVAKVKAVEISQPVKIMTGSVRNVSVQRNEGGQAAKGQWVLFMDADNRLPKDFLGLLAEQLQQNPEVDIFTTWLTVDDDDAQNKAIATVMNYTLEVYRRIGKPSAMGALIGCKRSLLDSVAYDPSYKFSEDSYFVQDAHQKGFNFAIFRTPNYVYSLRRMRKEGALKLMLDTAKLQLRYLQNDDFTEETNYPMLGGSYYEDYEKKFEHFPTFIKLNKLFKETTQQQMKSIKKFVKKLTEN